VPAVNKIDLANADIPAAQREITELLGCRSEEIHLLSAKTGVGVGELVAALTRLPSPQGEPQNPLRALIFDSQFDEFRGVVAYVRLVDGTVRAGDRIRFTATGAPGEVLEVGVFKPHYAARESLCAGEIGYLVTGLKDVRLCRVGDTVLEADDTTTSPLPGYREVKPVVFAGFFPAAGHEAALLREALDRLKLSDAALVYEPEHSPALGFGFRVGCLGLLHLDVTRERLRREHGLELAVTAPSVAYRVVTRTAATAVVRSPFELPDSSAIERVEEPWVELDVLAPQRYVGAVMPFVASRRGVYVTTEYLGDRAILRYRLPLASLLLDFYDTLKSVTAGYASMNYELADYQPADVVRLDLLVAEERVDALSAIVYRDEAYERGRRAVTALKEMLPRQQFELKIQAAVGGKIIAAERLAARRKDVTAKLYGGDVTRKQKLLKKQKAGKQRLAAQGRGRVPIPPEAYLRILKYEA
jgi:GTP-binding protein LepA